MNRIEEENRFSECTPHPVNPVGTVFSAVQYVEITHLREDFTTDGTDFTDVAMDGSGSAVASSKCSIREIREIRGPIPSLAAGRAVPSAPLRENILAKMDDSQTLQAKTVGREGGGFGAPGCTRHYQQDPAQSRLQAGAPTSLSGARTGSFFSAPSAPA
jgi:hypothetical protein